MLKGNMVYRPKGKIPYRQKLNKTNQRP